MVDQRTEREQRVTPLPALASLALVTAVCCALISWDVIHYREDRAEVRRARP